MPRANSFKRNILTKQITDGNSVGDFIYMSIEFFY